MSFTPLLRRMRKDKTNYRKRKNILIGKHLFAAVRISNQNVLTQISKPTKFGDQILVSAHSRELIKNGWHGSRKSIPACYLTGLLAGRKAVAKGVTQCILYTGNRMYTPKIAACVKGVIDAGVNITVDEETLPDEDRISGKHIADYANLLKDDKQIYNARFSGLLKAKFAPEGYPDHLDEVRGSILGKQVAKKEVEKAEVKEGEKIEKIEKVETEKKLEVKKEKKPKEVKKEKGVEKKVVRKKETKGGKKS